MEMMADRYELSYGCGPRGGEGARHRWPERSFVLSTCGRVQAESGQVPTSVRGFYAGTRWTEICSW